MGHFLSLRRGLGAALVLVLAAGCASTERASTDGGGRPPVDGAQAAIEALAGGGHAAMFWSRLGDRVVLYPIDSVGLEAHALRGAGPPTADLMMIARMADEELVRLGCQPKGWSPTSWEAVSVIDPSTRQRYSLYLVSYAHYRDASPLRIPVFPDGTVPAAVLHAQPEGVRL